MLNENCYHQNLKRGMSMKTFLIFMTYYISTKRSWKLLFSGKRFETVGSTEYQIGFQRYQTTV